MTNNQNMLDRMKAMMNYGLQTENKKTFASLEYNRVGCDGKMYGIVREGTKYYIKVSDKTKDYLKEDFDYIGGFRNRKNHEYSSYANALKQFDLKMRSLNEALGKNKTLIAESWNPEKQEFMVVEATEAMRDEIQRQRQIMKNAGIIMESNSCCVDGDCSCAQKNNTNLGKHGTGDAKTADSTFSQNPQDGEDLKVKGFEKNNIGEPQKPITEGDNGTLAWHKDGGDAQETMNDTYLDTSHGTSIGDGKPFNEPKNSKSEMHNGTVEEGTSMAIDCGNNQDSPSVGVGEIGDDDPFTEKAKNGLQEADEFDGEEDVEAEPMDDFDEDEELPETEDDDIDFDTEDGDDMDFGDEEDGVELDMDIDNEEGFDDGLSSENSEISALKADIQSLKDMLANISDKLGVSSEDTADAEFGDDTLYDEEPEIDLELDADDNDSVGAEEGDFEGEEEFADEPIDDFDEDEDDEPEIRESRSYRSMRRINEENRLDMWGKHPAYRKQPMKLPKTGEDKYSYNRDWNDESVHGEQPYGQQIGSGAPFSVDPQTIENAIAESVKRVLGRRNRI